MKVDNEDYALYRTGHKLVGVVDSWSKAAAVIRIGKALDVVVAPESISHEDYLTLRTQQRELLMEGER
jgi:hypothetical protein